MGCDARAHITGTVWQIRVKDGETVTRDQELVVLESMKMEMPVGAPCAGKVARIHVTEGQAVAEGDLLVSLDEVS
jgi:acetyl-CoA carboxylase biotin carboxyl carrier protein